ncbi:PilZ domain-containing protein [Sphingomonas sinipercae]|uniref:PilZ domain-containing protein n=1 Tax=Sphingomonas sinipercae TaxID=2714944 RepID=A0A6G7ZK78_9SPHN|nr:PilZ domain-containing protein [Sphingomonas sinipercae]QIL01381.1 PilZ domain-containing protein [Sphingomonas sinipercae]
MQSLTVSKREPKRSRVFLEASVDGGGGPVSARVLDISRSGALLQSEAPVVAGTEIRLICGGTHVDARVAWAESGSFGLEFTTPLLLGKLVDESGVKLRVSAPRAYRASDLDLHL